MLVWRCLQRSRGYQKSSVLSSGPVFPPLWAPRTNTSLIATGLNSPSLSPPTTSATAEWPGVSRWWKFYDQRRLLYNSCLRPGPTSICRFFPILQGSWTCRRHGLHRAPSWVSTFLSLQTNHSCLRCEPSNPLISESHYSWKLPVPELSRSKFCLMNRCRKSKMIRQHWKVDTGWSKHCWENWS